MQQNVQVPAHTDLEHHTLEIYRYIHNKYIYKVSYFFLKYAVSYGQSSISDFVRLETKYNTKQK